MRRALIAMMAALVLIIGMASRGHAQEDPAGSFVTPFPSGDTYKLLLIGDTMAEGLVGGLAEAMGADTQLVINRKHRPLVGLLRGDIDEELTTLEGDLQRESPNIVVVMLGISDRTSWRPPGGRERDRVRVGSDAWREEYSGRVDRLVKLLKKRSIAVYWIGLPIMRRPDINEDAQMMNEIYRERAFLNGMKYIDAAEGFASAEGGYEAYGPDLTGKSRLMRENDGIGLTVVGSRKLASFVEREVKRDLARARSERSIPLAGGETEQQRIRGRSPLGKAAGTATASATKASVGAVGPGWGPTSTTAARSSTGADEKADNSRVTVKLTGASGKEESVTIDIARPAIPASVISLVTRSETAARSPQTGEPIVAEITGGLTVMSSIISAVAPIDPSRRSAAAAQSSAYRLLVRGERLVPKPGRIDDFAWPRPDTPLYVPPAPPPAATPAAAAPPGRSEPTRATLSRRIPSPPRE